MKNFDYTNTINESCQKAKNEKNDFERFINNCKVELKEQGYCVAFTEEQIAAIKEFYPHIIGVRKYDWYFVLNDTGRNKVNA